MSIRQLALSAAFTVIGISALKADVKPFATDMYVKAPDFGCYIFRGTRSVAPYYQEAGWSVGAMPDGTICFTIADGTNSSAVIWRALDTSWRRDEWNHVAASFANGELSLWVNGEKSPKRSEHVCQAPGIVVTNTCFVRSIDSPRAVVTNGYDVMTGGLFKGKVAGFRFLDHVIDNAEVARRAAKIALMRANDPEAPRLVPDEKGLDVAPPCAPPQIPLTIQPTPQQVELSKSSVLLKPPFTITVPAEERLADVGGELLRNLMAQGCGVTAAVVTVGAELPDSGTRFAFVRDARLGREEYRITGDPVKNGYCVTIHGAGRGYSYAADTLRQLLRIRSIENGRRLSLPEHVRISDHPLMPYRMTIYDWGYVTQKSFLHFAQARLNTMDLHPYHPPAKVEDLRRVCDLAESYGVDIVGGFWYLLTKPWTFSDPASMAEFKAHIDLLGKAGVKGLRLRFDDLRGKPGEAWVKDPEMRRRFSSEGAFHNALVCQCLEWASAYTNLTSSFISVTPRYYYRNWGKNGQAYFADFTRGFYERGVFMENTAFQSEDVARLGQDGAESYCYGMNGMFYTYRFFTWYICPETFRWSWYTWYVDLNGKGPVVCPEAMTGIRTLHKRTQLFQSGANSDLARVQMGILSWNPASFDPDLGDRATAQAFFGTGAYEQQRIIETALLPIIGYIGAYRGPNSVEWDLQTIPRRVGPSKKEFAGYWRNFRAAEKALANLKKAFANQKTPFDRPDLGDHRELVLERYRQTLDSIRKHLPQE